MPDQRCPTTDAVESQHPLVDVDRSVARYETGRVLMAAAVDSFRGHRPEPAEIGTRLARAAGVPDGLAPLRVGELALAVADAMAESAHRAVRTVSDRLLDSLLTAPATSAGHASVPASDADPSATGTPAPGMPTTGGRDHGADLREMAMIIEFLTTVFLNTVDGAQLDGWSDWDRNDPLAAIDDEQWS